jgi:autotransporter-associated beta strand protein
MQLAFRQLSASLLVLLGVLAVVNPAISQAAFDVFPEAQSDYLPGTFVVLANPNTGNNYLATITDPIFGTTQTGYSYASVLDTGSSGSVICATEAVGRNLPQTGQIFADQGIGGTESFYVSSPTTVKLAAVDSGAVTVSWDGSTVTENVNMFNTVGVNKLQIRESDPTLDVGFGLDTTIMVNTIGTPLINQYVMHVKSGSQAFAWQMDTLGSAPVNYVPSELVAKSTLPSGLNLGSSELVLVPKVGGSASAMHVPLNYQNYITDPNPAPSVSTNPTIPGVIASLGTHSATSDWLFDSGAAVTMMGRNLAASLGIDLNSPGITSTTVLGIGGTVSFQGYQIDQLALTTASGSKIDFHNVVVFVPGAGALPADFPGIFGMNLLNNSFSGVSADLFGGITEEDPVSSSFSDWYVVSGAQPTTIAWQGGNGAGPTKWDVAANWNPNSAVPNGAGVTVTFGNQAAGNNVVDLGTSGKKVGGLIFLGMTNTTIQSSGGFSLTLDNSGQLSTIDVTGSHTIAAPVVLNNDAQISGSGTLTLSAGISGAHDLNITGSVVASGIQVSSLGIASGAKLTMVAATNSAYAGNIRGDGPLTKSGAGTLTLSGTNTYGGVTTVTAGTLVLTPSAQAPVFDDAGADVQGGKIVFSYAGSPDPAAIVRGMLIASYHHGLWDRGQFRDSTAAATGLTLGCVDDTSSHQVVVMATYPGDFNLDGVVDNLDRIIWFANAFSGSTWQQGDANYDGVVDGRDRDILFAHIGLPRLASALPAGVTPLPEPGTLLLLAIGLAGLLAYVRQSRGPAK